MSDKGIIYIPNNTPGVKPIGVGHSYSLLAFLPEKSSSFPWILPLDVKRVRTDEKGHEVGFIQMEEFLAKEDTPFYQKFCVLVSDSLYGVIANRDRAAAHDNLVWIYRMRGNRNVYFQVPEGETRKKYGPKMKLNDPQTHLKPDEQGEIHVTTHRGKKRVIRYKQWNNMLLRGSQTFKGYLHPLDFIRYEVYDTEGELVFKHPLWLGLEGKKRNEISPQQAYESYGQRYDLEQFF